MSEIQEIKSTRSIAFFSSLKDDVWHDQEGRNAFESWHFDALSDDGREALVITFHDNYRFSPRYFQQERSKNANSSEVTHRFPVISFAYSVDGKVVLRSANEFRRDEFSADKETVRCSVGGSSFRIDMAEYGSGYLIQIDLATARRRRIKAEIEWLLVEADLSNSLAENNPAAVLWNMVAPRSDVSGRITLIGSRGKNRKMVHFRGTGYHDHLRSDRSIEETIASRLWGRAHFTDSTVVFQHVVGCDGQDVSNLFLVRDGSIYKRDAQSEMQMVARNRYGIKTPRRLSLVTDDNIRLRVKPLRVIQGGFFESKMLSEMTLMLRDGKPRKTNGITEFSNPARMKKFLFRWISDLRTGRNGRSPLF